MIIVRNCLGAAALLLLAACAMTPAQTSNNTAPSPFAGSSASSSAPPKPATSRSTPATVPASATSVAPIPASQPARPGTAIAAHVVIPAVQPRVVASAHTAAPKAAIAAKPASTEHVAHKPRTRQHTEATADAKRRTITPAVAKTLDISGRVELTAGRGQQVATGDLTHTLVYFVPKTGNVGPRPGQFTVFTHNREYDPGAMAIPLGSTITFVNLDDVRHNEFSVTPGSAFNLGYQAAGEKTPHTFARPGLVLIGCRVHRQMELDVLVIPTIYVARVSATGTFTIHGLPAGPGTLHFWNPRALPVALSISVPVERDIDQRLVETKSSMPVQLNVDAQP